MHSCNLHGMMTKKNMFKSVVSLEKSVRFNTTVPLNQCDVCFVSEFIIPIIVIMNYYY